MVLPVERNHHAAVNSVKVVNASNVTGSVMGNVKRVSVTETVRVVIAVVVVAAREAAPMKDHRARIVSSSMMMTPR
jgi:hypothetical protein